MHACCPHLSTVHPHRDPPLVGVLNRNVPEPKAKPDESPPLGAQLLYRVPLVMALTNMAVNIALTYQLSLHHLVREETASELRGQLSAAPMYSHQLWWRWLAVVPWTPSETARRIPACHPIRVTVTVRVKSLG